MEIRELNIKKNILFFSEIYKQIPSGENKKKYCSAYIHTYSQDDYNYRVHKKSFLCYKKIYFWFGIFHDSTVCLVCFYLYKSIFLMNNSFEI